MQQHMYLKSTDALFLLIGDERKLYRSTLAFAAISHLSQTDRRADLADLSLVCPVQ